MKKIFCLFFSFLLISICGYSAAPTLSANTIQPTYPGTSKPYLNIISGSGKTSYVSAALNDPTDPASVYGIYFTITGTVTSVSVTSNKTAVVPNANLSFTQSGGIYILKINPASVGLATISIIATNAGQNSATYKISYAVSASSSYPDKTIWPTIIADASGAAAIDDDYMFVCDDETNVLRLYNRKNSGKDLYTYDITSAVGNPSKECDLEGASTSVKYNTGKRIYWIGSLGNNKDGDLKPDRDRVIATDVSGSGAGSTISVKSYSTKFRTALISWGNTNGWNFTASAASGVVPKRIDGFNVEGLSVTHGGDTGYIGFRAPCVPIKGTTPISSNRKYAVVAPVTNLETMMNGSGSVSTNPVIADPILFDLDGLGIRSIEKVGTSLYLIVAGLYTGGGTPALYLWDGKVPANSGINPITVSSTFSKLTKLNLPGLTDLVQISSDGVAEGHPEALVAEQIGEILYIHIICDNGTIDYYNSGDEAKALTNNEHKKFRYDNFVYDMTNYVANCTNANIPFITNTTYVAGDTYQWQVNTGSGYTDITDNALYSGATNDTLQLVNAPSSMYGYTYKCKITNGAFVTYSNEFTLEFKAYWKGTVSNAWENPANWGCNIVPDINTDVYINQGTPVLSSNTSIRSLTVRPTASVKVDSSFTLTVVH